MKTTINLRMALVAAITVLFSLLAVKSHAQVNSPYSITNGLNCTIKITWDFFVKDASGNCIYCGSGGPVKIAAGRTHTLVDADFGNCWPACDININVIEIGGSTTGLPVTANSGNPNPSLPFVLGCNTAASNINWSLFGSTVNP